MVDPWFFEYGADFIHIVWYSERTLGVPNLKVAGCHFPAMGFAAEMEFLDSHLEFDGIEF